MSSKWPLLVPIAQVVNQLAYSKTQHVIAELLDGDCVIQKIFEKSAQVEATSL